MLPKNVYSKVLQGLNHIRKQWDEDRAEDPKRVPYEIDMQLRLLIERCMREGKVRRSEEFIRWTVDYLVEKGLIVRSPYGGHMFPLPPDAEPLPSKEEFIKQLESKIDEIIGD